MANQSVIDSQSYKGNDRVLFGMIAGVLAFLAFCSNNSKHCAVND